MNSKQKLLESYLDEIKQLRKEKWSQIRIANKFNCSEDAMRRFLKNHNISTSKSMKLNDPNDFKQEIIERYNAGESVSSIQKNLNMSLTTLCAHMHRWGIDVSIRASKHNHGLLKDRTDEILEMYIARGWSMAKIAKKFGISASTNIRKILIKKGVLRDIRESFYKVKLDYFTDINTPNKAWLLGFLYADGNVSGTLRVWKVNLQYRDIEILERIKEEIGFSGPIKVFEKQPGNRPGQTKISKMCLLAVNRAQMCQDLIKWGCVPNKTWQLQMPDCLSKDLLSHFVRGLWDGDGHISQNCKILNLVGSKCFIEELCTVLPFKIRPLIYRDSERYPNDIYKKVTKITISKRVDVKYALEWMYGDCKKYLYLKRKYELAKLIF